MLTKRPVEEDDSREDFWAIYQLRLNRVLSWGGDIFRLFWSLGFWNMRKSWFRLRGGRSVCPCQDPSDSGLPGETRCLPAETFSRSSRFRHVCPLLKETPDGWKCSAATVNVRPFWGRALLIYATVAFAAYLAGAAAALKFFHRIGYVGLGYVDVVWPGHWSRFSWIQAKYFREEGLRALQTGDFGRALLHLSTVRQVAPDDYQTGLLLGQLWSAAGSHGYSDAVFDSLLRDFPAKAETTSISFHDQLLIAQRFDRLAQLCLQRLGAGTKQTEEWERSLFFALDHGRLAEKFAVANASALAALPPRVGLLLQAYLLWQQGEHDAAIGRLTPYRVGTGSTVFMRLQIEALARLGRADEATTLLNHYAPALGGAFEYSALQYTITASRGETHLRQSDFLLLLRRPLTIAEFDRICALLIATGDRPSLLRLRRHFRNPSLADAGRAYAAFWIASLVCGDEESMDFAARELQRTEKFIVPKGKKIDFLSADPNNPLGVRALLNTVPLMRETIFSLVAEATERRLLVKPRR